MSLRATGRQRVLVVGADAPTFALLAEWLAAEGVQAISDGPAGEPYDLVLVDASFPRGQGGALLARVADEHPGAPVVALSSGFFASVACTGACARELGVAGVLPKPVTREALLAAVRRFVPTQQTLGGGGDRR